MARLGRWLLGSRLAGALASFFALHPQTVWASSFTMSENGMLFVSFLMLALARPWLDHGPSPPAARRAPRCSGLALAWLVLAGPFAYWAIALAALAAAEPYKRCKANSRDAPTNPQDALLSRLSAGFSFARF